LALHDSLAPYFGARVRFSIKRDLPASSPLFYNYMLEMSTPKAMINYMVKISISMIFTF
jgi:hypothetical protein